MTIEDLGSKNGTWLNGSRVDAPLQICDQDKVRIGSATLTFREMRSADRATTSFD